LSSIIVSGVDQNGWFEKPGPATAETAISAPVSGAVPAIRRFKRGSVIAYSFSLHNARVDKSAGRTNLTIKVNLYRDGKLVSEGEAAPLKTDGQVDLTRIDDFGYLRLSQTEPGDYALQIVIRDLLGGKNAVSSQWVDFEVVD
jgi:hypothetical protein